MLGCMGVVPEENSLGVNGLLRPGVEPVDSLVVNAESMLKAVSTFCAAARSASSRASTSI